MQQIINGTGSTMVLAGILAELAPKKILLVAGKSFHLSQLRENIEKTLVSYIHFDNFSPNPTYESVLEGVKIFNEERCDAILAVGGGSAIDVSKCIKLFCKMNPAQDFTCQNFMDSHIPLIAIPTTAGTGSESTKFAVIYRNGIKLSIAHDSLIPDYAILDATSLISLPVYQKKCAMMDAFCQGIESWWSINSTPASIPFSKMTVELIMRYWHEYIFDANTEAAEKILLAANYSGQAINIAQTTAPHAMSYKLSSMYGIPHGHAVSLTLPEVWVFMNENLSSCADNRGAAYLSGVLDDICTAMNMTTTKSAIKYFLNMMSIMDLKKPRRFSNNDPHILAESVNQQRLKNNPVALDTLILKNIYNSVIEE